MSDSLDTRSEFFGLDIPYVKFSYLFITHEFGVIVSDIMSLFFLMGKKTFLNCLS